VQVRSAGSPRDGALRGGRRRAHRLPHEAAHAGWHHAPALHRTGAAPAGGQSGTPAQDTFDARPWRLRPRGEPAAISGPRSGSLGRGGGTLCRGGNCGQLREASARSEVGLGRVAAQDVRRRCLLVPKVRRPATGAGIPDAGRRHPAHSASPSAARAAAPPGSGAGATAAGALGVTLGGGAPPLEQLAATGRPRKAGVRLERDVQASLGASFNVQGMSQGPPGPPPTPALARNRAPMPPILARATAPTCGCPPRGCPPRARRRGL
jgi:hypothetical protein